MEISYTKQNTLFGMAKVVNLICTSMHMGIGVGKEAPNGENLGALDMM